MIFSLFLILMALVIFALARIAYRWETQGVRLTAKIIGETLDPGRIIAKYYPKVRYSYEGKTYEVTALNQVFSEKELNSLEEISIVILPTNPGCAKSFAPGEYKRGAILLVSMGIGVLALAAWVYKAFVL